MPAGNSAALPMQLAASDLEDVKSVPRRQEVQGGPTDLARAHTTPRLTLPSTSRLPGLARTTRTLAYSAVLHARSNTDAANSADADVLHVHQSSGFLNRVRWFDSARGHSSD